MNIKYIIKKDDISIKQILKEKFEMSEKLIIKLKQNKRIYINDEPVYITYKIKENDILYIDLDFTEASDNIISNKNIKLNILYEDEFLLILDKDSGIPVHPSSMHYTDSLSNGVKYYFEKNNINKNVGILDGKLNKKEGTICAPISRKEGSIIEREVSSIGKEAVTHYKVITESDKYSEVEFLLETGRTHQIRVHSKFIGHPILGDDLYGLKNERFNRHLLHAYKVTFIHPISKKNMCIISDLPKVFREILK